MTDQHVQSPGPARVVLEGVPRVGFYRPGERCPEDFPFAGSLRAVLEYLGEGFGCQHVQVSGADWQLGCTYAYLLATSGLAWRLLWNPTSWDYANGDVLLIAADPLAPLRRTFEAVGRDHEIVLREDWAQKLGLEPSDRSDGTGYRSYGGPDGPLAADETTKSWPPPADGLPFVSASERIVASIRERGRPVLAFGVVGPPECCVVAGYDEGGDVLLGWSYFQEFPEFGQGVEIEPSGYFRKRDWLADTVGLITIGGKREKPPLGEIARSSLRWAISLTRTPCVGHYRSGLAAYTAWAEALLRDDDFAGDVAVVRDRYRVHYDTVGIVAEGRWYGAQYLKELAKREPAMADDLSAAARCYEAEHDLMWDVWNLAGGNAFTDAQVTKLTEPEVRRRIAPVILQARERDAEAAERLERALGR